jgi:hypothetical protein
VNGLNSPCHSPHKKNRRFRGFLVFAPPPAKRFALKPSYGNEQRGENCEIKNISSQCVSRGKYEDASGNQSEKNG